MLQLCSRRRLTDNEQIIRGEKLNDTNPSRQAATRSSLQLISCRRGAAGRAPDDVDAAGRSSSVHIDVVRGTSTASQATDNGHTLWRLASSTTCARGRDATALECRLSGGADR